MRTTRYRGMAAGLAMLMPVAAAAQVTTDGGTIDAAETARFFNQPGYSPYAGHAYPMRPLWGEQHLHTSWFGDAIAAGTASVPTRHCNTPRAPRSPRAPASASG